MIDVRDKIMYRAFILNVGLIREPMNYNGFVGVSDFSQSFETIFLYDESDEVFSYIFTVDDEKSYVGSTDYGVADAMSLRSLLPEFLAERWSDILLCSIDYDEIHEEGLHHLFYSPDYDVEDPMRPFFTRFEVANADQFTRYIAVRSIVASFEQSSDSDSNDIFMSLSSDGISRAIEMPLARLGTVVEFATDSEILCFIER